MDYIKIAETDLVTISRNEVIEAAKRWKKARFPLNNPHTALDTEAELVGALVLLESREADAETLAKSAAAMEVTKHLA